MITVKEFIGKNCRYNADSGSIIVDTNRGPQTLVDVRGWARMHNYFKDPSGFIDYEGMGNFFDEVGSFIADAVNEKLKKAE